MRASCFFVLVLTTLSVSAQAAETIYPHLPPHEQIDAALDNHISVLNAETAATQPAAMVGLATTLTDPDREPTEWPDPCPL